VFGVYLNYTQAKLHEQNAARIDALDKKVHRLGEIVSTLRVLNTVRSGLYYFLVP
jgi:hypothetical protein